MKLGEIGEAKLLEWIRKTVPLGDDVSLGIGDDCGVFRYNDTSFVMTSDMLNEGTHIYKGMSPEQIGRKAVAVNYSDIASMGAKPLSFLFSLGIPDNYTEEVFKGIFEGVISECKRWNTNLIGGDLTKTSGLVLSGFALGVCEGSVLKRSGVKEGDIVAVTGNIGSAAAGWRIIEGGVSLNNFNEEEKRKIEGTLLKACLEPQARVGEGQILGASGSVHSCVDSSDGLALSLGFLRDTGRGSKLGFDIYEDRIPIRPELYMLCERTGLDFDEVAYHIGEDFELVFTIDPDSFSDIKNKIEKIGGTVSEIGKAVPGDRINLHRKDGTIAELKEKGWDSYKKAENEN